MAIAKVRDILKMRQEGSHRQFRHASKRGTVTVAGKEGLTLPHDTVNSILKQAGLPKEDLTQ